MLAMESRRKLHLIDNGEWARGYGLAVSLDRGVRAQELTREPVIVLMGQGAIQEYGNGIMCFQTLLHILLVLWVSNLDTWPAKPLELGRFG